MAKWWRPFKQRWKWRQGLFANLVAGAAEWRRILILQSEGQAFSLQQAQQFGTRMAFQTQGGFLKNMWWRYVMGLLWFLPAAFYLYVHPPTWSSQDHVPQLAAEAIDILSFCYLAAMGFVTWVFRRAKRLTR
jgi:FtsH-binding integral membrane protein